MRLSPPVSVSINRQPLLAEDAKDPVDPLGSTSPVVQAVSELQAVKRNMKRAKVMTTMS
jgi:hypothetical protein